MSQQPAYQQLPQHLSNQELSDPHTVIADFINTFDVSNVRRFIRKWTGSVYRPANWENQSPADFLYFYEHLLKLIEAANLIMHMDNTERKGILLVSKDTSEAELYIPKNYCNPHHPREVWDAFPRSLRWKEYINPYRVFSAFFRYKNLPDWKEELHNILHISLSGDSMEDTGESIDILSIKSHLDKLADACQLIHVRELETEKSDYTAEPIN